MRNVVYVAPFPLETTVRFGEAIGSLDGVRLIGVFQQPPAGPTRFDAFVPCDDVFDARHLVAAVAEARRRYGPIHRVLGILENLQETLATVREALDLPGMRPEVVRRFRDKAAMKDALRAAGLPCARHARVDRDEDAWALAREVGFPLVLKPLAGAGAVATARVGSPDELAAYLASVHQRPLQAEEFLVGDEHSFESWCVAGRPLFHSLTRYYPTPLEVTENPYLQWVVFAPRRIEVPGYEEARRVGVRALEVLGMGTGMTHMEWFHRQDGSVAIGEIAARPPGACIVALNHWVHGMDFYRVWARLVVDEAFDGPWERRYAAAAAFLRQPGEGRVVGVDGLDEAQRSVGPLVVEHRLPTAGIPKRGGYEGEGWVILRHPEDEVVERGVLELIRTLRVRYA